MKTLGKILRAIANVLDPPEGEAANAPKVGISLAPQVPPELHAPQPVSSLPVWGWGQYL